LSLTRSIFIILAALVFSALLWAYVRLSSAYESDIDLPAKVIAPKGYALSGGLPGHLHARVRGAGWQIMLLNFTSNANFRFDLTERAVAGPGGSLVLKSDEIANAAVLPSELRVLKVEPDSLRLDFSKAVQKEIAVVPHVEVTPAKGFVLGMTTITPAHVTVVGSQQILDSLVSISTSPIQVNNAKEPVDQVVQISDSLDNFITVLNAPKINVHVNVEPIGERTLTMVPIAIDALPPDHELVLSPGLVSVTVRGGVDELAKLAAANIHARVVYDPVYFDTAHTVAPKIEVPKEITYLSCEPRNLRFIVRKRSSHATP
jgi:hypothetical protein